MNLKQKIVGAAGAVGSVLMTGVVMAQTSGGAADLTAAVTTELSAGKAQLYVIGGAVLTLVAVVALIRHMRRAAN